MSYMKLLVITLLCFSTIKTDYSFGRCRTITYELSTFNLSRYTGKWYEAARFKHAPFQKGDCTQAVYSDL